jgi:hypothetical protein
MYTVNIPLGIVVPPALVVFGFFFGQVLRLILGGGKQNWVSGFRIGVFISTVSATFTAPKVCNTLFAARKPSKGSNLLFLFSI